MRSSVKARSIELAAHPGMCPADRLSPGTGQLVLNTSPQVHAYLDFVVPNSRQICYLAYNQALAAGAIWLAKVVNDQNQGRDHLLVRHCFDAAHCCVGLQAVGSDAPCAICGLSFAGANSATRHMGQVIGTRLGWVNQKPLANYRWQYVSIRRRALLPGQAAS